VGKHSLIGVGANVIPCIQIGEAVVIGAGAVVVSDITSYVTAVGIPAKPLSR
jgi:serine acetyltransferase